MEKLKGRRGRWRDWKACEGPEGGRGAGVRRRGAAAAATWFACPARPLTQGLRVELATRGAEPRACGRGEGGAGACCTPRPLRLQQGGAGGLGGGRGGGARRQRVASWAAGGLEGAEEEEEEEVSLLGWEQRWPREAGSAAPPSRRPPRGAARLRVPSGAAAARSGG